MLRKLSLLLVAASFIACAGTQPSQDPVTNNAVTESGDTVWTSGNFDGSVQIDKSFKFLGSQNGGSQNSIRKSYFWQKNENTFLYIVDWRHRKTWTFPIDNDGLLGRSNDPQDPSLLAYEPSKHSIWKNMSKKSAETAQKLGIKIPECYAAFEKVKMSSSRGSAFWVILVEKTDCDYKGLNGIGERFTDAISM